MLWGTNLIIFFFSSFVVKKILSIADRESFAHEREINREIRKEEIRKLESLSVP